MFRDELFWGAWRGMLHIGTYVEYRYTSEHWQDLILSEIMKHELASHNAR